MGITLMQIQWGNLWATASKSLALLIKFHFPIAGSNFPHSWHNLHACEYDSYCNGLDLQSPKFKTSLTCEDNQVLFITQISVLCALKNIWMGLLFLASNCSTLKTVSGRVTRTQRRVYIILVNKDCYLCIRNLSLAFLARWNEKCGVNAFCFQNQNNSVYSPQKYLGVTPFKISHDESNHSS